MAECHPVGFRFVMEARERGATIIHVDPRFTRTSANADIYAPLRPGTDITFLGGLINYVLSEEQFFREYVVAYTNAATIIGEDFRDTEDLDGIFSGYQPESGTYDAASWRYEVGEGGVPLRDETLQDPRCVFQILKRHFARYTPEVVERVCGTPRDVFVKIAETLVANSGRDRTTAFCYALGWTQHTVGVQNIRAAAILQLLLGNIGRPGGGILALRGHAAIQGSTDIPTLYNLLPGYLNIPYASNRTLSDYLLVNQAETGWWNNAPKYMVSMLKAWYGEHAMAENEWGYQYLNKLDDKIDYSYYPMFFRMKDGGIRGLFVLGENYAVGGPGSKMERAAMRKLEWCVIRDPFLVETANFWKMDGVDPHEVDTEVFFMPAAWAAEKDGSLTNTQRMLQWHEKAIDPPGDARSETWFFVHLGRRLRELYAGSAEERDHPLLAMTWDYPLEGVMQEPRVESVLEEISGYTVADDQQVAGFADLKDDGSTACGCWIYSGVVPAKGRNLSASRIKDAPDEWTNNSRWGWAWPANRRILYNRASADPDGNPWSERKRLVWWDSMANDGKGQWVGYDVPDFVRDKAPESQRVVGGKGAAGLTGAEPFIMQSDGRGWLFAPRGVKDGPLPAHYEPMESPLPNVMYKRQNNPAVIEFDRPDNPMNGMDNPAFPYIITTYRLTEHHTSGAMSRWSTWLSELQPELFAEINPELAAELDIRMGDWVTVTTSRAEIEARAMVTERMRPMRIEGKTLHVIGMPYHWGPAGVVTGDIVNDLIGIALDPTSQIHEAKVFTCNMRKGRRTTGPAIPSGGPHASVAEGGAVARIGSEGAEMARFDEQANILSDVPEPSKEAASYD